MEAREGEALPVPKKRSLFTKAALAKNTEAEDAVAFFSRANELQEERLAEEERRRKRRIAKLERKRSSGSVERRLETPEEDVNSSGPVKKRRHSSQGVDEDDATVSGNHEEVEVEVRDRR